MLDHSGSPNGYVRFLGDVLRCYREVKDAEALCAHVSLVLVDVTHTPEWQEMAAANPLPPGFSLHVFDFKDPEYGSGVVDVSFHESRLVNLRAQLFFEGWFKNRRLRKCIEQEIFPLIEKSFGSPVSSSGPDLMFQRAGLVCMISQGQPGPYLSIGVTDEEFAF